MVLLYIEGEMSRWCFGTQERVWAGDVNMRVVIV